MTRLTRRFYSFFGKKGYNLLARTAPIPMFYAALINGRFAFILAFILAVYVCFILYVFAVVVGDSGNTKRMHATWESRAMLAKRFLLILLILLYLWSLYIIYHHLW